MIPSQQLLDHPRGVRSLVYGLGVCLFYLPPKPMEVLWVAAGVGTNTPRRPLAVAQMLHMSLSRERAIETRAIMLIRAAARRGCPRHNATVSAASATVTGVQVTLPAAVLTMAARTVGSRPSRRATPTAPRRHHHRTRTRRAPKGTALETAAIAGPGPPSPTVWLLVVLDVLLVGGLVGLGRRWRRG